MFTVHIGGDNRAITEYEADSLEEKNKIYRLLSLIVSHNNSDRTSKVIIYAHPLIIAQWDIFTHTHAHIHTHTLTHTHTHTHTHTRTHTHTYGHALSHMG